MDSKATLTTDTNVASRGSTDYRGSTGLKHTHASRSIENHRDLLRKSNPESELFFIPDILSLLRARAILRLPNVFWGLSLYKFQAAAHHHEPFSATHFSVVYLFMVVALETAVCQYVYVSHCRSRGSFCVSSWLPHTSLPSMITSLRTSVLVSYRQALWLLHHPQCWHDC